jgi:chromosome segregation ATPase
MDAFNIMGRRDSLGGDLSLAVRGIEIQMDEIRSDIQVVAGKEDRAKLEIAELEREIGVVEYERREVELRIANLAEKNEWRKRTVEDIAAEVEAGSRRLAQAEELLELSIKAEEEAGGGLGDTDGGDPVGTVLRQTASREQAGRVGDLLARVDELSRTVGDNRIKADSLRVQIIENEHEIDRLEMKSEIVLTKKSDDFRQEIADLEIALARDLPSEKARLEAQLEGKRVQLGTISPLELVGATSVTDKPVRPRKLRALTILTFLALLGGICLALVVEYVVANRRAILQPARD